MHPLSYRDGMSFTWENGRILKSISKNNNTINMKYDSNGMRTQKSSNSGTTNYYYDSNNNLIGLTEGKYTLFFYYDSEGSPISFSCNGEMYYYLKNIQGDIVKIVNKEGKEYVKYEYDAWGKIINQSGETILRDLNPLRYRGYVYDIETGLYYLQSRYYDPVTGRFINADDLYFIYNQENVLGENLYTYCYNQYIMNIDITGNKSSSKSVYNRDKAIKYAKRYYNSPNTSFPYFSRGDCANFVSQCINAGGINYTKEWYCNRIQRHTDHPRYDYTKTWSCVVDQFRYFLLWGFTKYVIRITKKTSENDFKRLIKQYNIRKGDLIYMDFDGNGSLDHATMISSIANGKTIKYTGHTNSQFDKKISEVFKSNKKCIMKIVVLC